MAALFSARFYRWKIYDKRFILIPIVFSLDVWCFCAKIVYFILFLPYVFFFHCVCVSNRYQSRCWTRARVYRINSECNLSYWTWSSAYMQRQELGQIQSKYYYSMANAFEAHTIDEGERGRIVCVLMMKIQNRIKCVWHALFNSSIHTSTLSIFDCCNTQRTPLHWIRSFMCFANPKHL